MGCLFEPLIRKQFNFFETVSSIHLNLQFQLRSVREVFKDLNVISPSLSAWWECSSLGKIRRVKVAYYILTKNYFEIQLIKAAYQQTVFILVDYIPGFAVFIQ